MAPAAKLSLLLSLQADKGAQFTLGQVHHFSRAIPTEGQARSLMQLGSGNLSYSMLFSVTASQISEKEVSALLCAGTSITETWVAVMPDNRE